MRPFLLSLLILPFLALAAEAACTLPDGDRVILGRDHDRLFLRDDNRAFLLCLLNEIAALKREQERLRRLLGEQGRIVDDLPVPYRNEDGKITVEPGRPVSSASFVLSSRQTGGAASLALDQEVVEALCAGSGGCQITVILRGIGLRPSDPVDTEVSGPCRLAYDTASGGWSRGAGCATVGNLVGGAATDGVGDPLGPASGIDGDGSGPGSEGTGAAIAVAAGCILADSEVNRLVAGDRGPTFAPDRARGLFLIAAPALAPGLRRFRCELKIE